LQDLGISKRELRLFQEVARDLIELDDRQIAIALSAGEIEEVSHENDDE
jgi:hypothetical protein